MPVSSWLQKYFDSQRKKKWDLENKFLALKDQIDPAFLKSFSEFHERILWIVDENPESEEMVWKELEDLENTLSETNKKYNLKRAAHIISHWDQ